MSFSGLLSPSDLDSLEDYPYFAMVLDGRHNVIAANSYFLETAGHDLGECPIACYQVIHADEPHPDCPLAVAARTHSSIVSHIDDERLGRLRVEVTPLDLRGVDGVPLFLHLAGPE